MANVMDVEINAQILHKYFKLFLKNEMKEYGLNATDSLVILMLYTKEHIGAEKFVSAHTSSCFTQDQLISQLHYDKGVMTRTMKTLESKKLVVRSVNPNDSRSSLFSLTEKGINMKKEIINAMKKWSESVFNDVEDVDKANAALSLMAENAKKLLN